METLWCPSLSLSSHARRRLDTLVSDFALHDSVTWEQQQQQNKTTKQTNKQRKPTSTYISIKNGIWLPERAGYRTVINVKTFPITESSESGSCNPLSKESGKKKRRRRRRGKRRRKRRRREEEEKEEEKKKK